MGTQDAAMAAIKGLMDWNNAYGSIDWLRELVAKRDKPIEVHEGDGLFGVKPHLCDPKQVLNEQIDIAFQHIEEANRICFQVLEDL